MEPCIERSIAERTSEQLGLITRSQLLDIGLRTPAIRRLVAVNRMVQVGGATYRLAGVPPSYRSSVLAACLDVGGVASHRSAARLHGVEGFTDDPTVEVLIPNGKREPRFTGAIVHRTTNLHPDDVVTVGPIPTTSIPRTLLGLAALEAEVTNEQLRDAIDTLVRDGRASDRWLWWHLEQRRCRGRNGVARMEDALAARAGTGRTESWLEREMLRCLAAAHIPMPVVQRRIAAKGAFVARVDFLYERERLVIEVSGHRTHSTRRQREADTHRRNQLLLAGYRVMEFTYDALVQRPEIAMEMVRAALATAHAA